MFEEGLQEDHRSWHVDANAESQRSGTHRRQKKPLQLLSVANCPDCEQNDYKIADNIGCMNRFLPLNTLHNPLWGKHKHTEHE